MATAVKNQSAAAPGESIVNNQTRVIESMEVGDRFAQGDLYFVCIAGTPAGAKPRKNRQLADGATMGSRHVADSGEVFDCSGADVARAVKAATGLAIDAKYMGPIVQTPALIDHPEHGPHDYRCKGTVAVVFQRSLDMEEREQRVID